MQVKIFDHNTALDQYAADLVIQTTTRLQQPVLGLATGSTPIGIYKSIVEQARASGLSFRHVTTYNLDEYVGLDSTHPQSYASYMRQHLFGQLDFQTDNIHLPNGMAADLQAECKLYDQGLSSHPIDLQLLGIGHNGHIGFNEPAHGLQGSTHVVELKPATLEANARFFASIEEVPRFAITMGVGSILKARQIVLAVRGEDKAAIVKEALLGPITTACPASLLQTHANVIVLLDKEAGKEWIAHEKGSSLVS